MDSHVAYLFDPFFPTTTFFETALASGKRPLSADSVRGMVLRTSARALDHVNEARLLWLKLAQNCDFSEGTFRCAEVSLRATFSMKLAKAFLTARLGALYMTCNARSYLLSLISLTTSSLNEVRLLCCFGIGSGRRFGVFDAGETGARFEPQMVFALQVLKLTQQAHCSMCDQATVTVVNSGLLQLDTGLQNKHPHCT